MAEEKPPAETPKKAKDQPQRTARPKDAKPSGRRTPAEWRERLGADRAEHAAADVVHGWAVHQHQEAQPMRLSEEDYRQALKSAPRIRPHLPAMSPHVARRRLKGDELEAYLAARSN